MVDANAIAVRQRWAKGQQSKPKPMKNLFKKSEDIRSELEKYQIENFNEIISL